MSIYERFGVEVNINVSEISTRHCGALMKKEVIEAMNEAAKDSVRLDELQVAASKMISQMTHAEAGIVTTGASAALTLGIAACIAGFDAARMNRLPDIIGVRNEVVMPWHQISGYSHAIRAAGAKIIGAGVPPGTTPPHEVYTISGRDIETAITEKTVAIGCAFGVGSHPPLEDVVDIAKKYNLPVILDASLGVPPVENLYKFIDMGVDLVCFSGGKGLRGPQAAGILCGRRDLVSSALVQMVDAGTFYEWSPVSLIPMDKIRGIPEHGIGRGMKVSKEAIMGLLVALQCFTGEEVTKEQEHLTRLLVGIEAGLKDVMGVATKITKGSCDYPILEVEINEKVVGKSATEVARELENGKPRIYSNHKYLQRGIVYIHSVNIDEAVARIVGERLSEVITC